MRDYSSRIEAKRFDAGAEKDRLLDLIAAEIQRRHMTTRDVQALVPGIPARAVSDIRQGMRSAGSIARLREVAAALEIMSEAA